MQHTTATEREKIVTKKKNLFSPTREHQHSAHLEKQPKEKRPGLGKFTAFWPIESTNDRLD